MTSEMTASTLKTLWPGKRCWPLSDITRVCPDRLAKDLKKQAQRENWRYREFAGTKEYFILDLPIDIQKAIALNAIRMYDFNKLALPTDLCAMLCPECGDLHMGEQVHIGNDEWWCLACAGGQS